MENVPVTKMQILGGNRLTSVHGSMMRQPRGSEGMVHDVRGSGSRRGTTRMGLGVLNALPFAPEAPN
jgi:hypothetical protein